MTDPLPLRLPEVTCHRLRVYHPQAKFPVALVVDQSADGVSGALHYRDAMLSDERAGRLANTFLTHLRALTAAVR